jgi:hypothetical protein
VHDYAIALPTDSPIKEPINRALLKIIHRADWKDLVQRYVGGTDQVAADRQTVTLCSANRDARLAGSDETRAIHHQAWKWCGGPWPDPILMRSAATSAAVT